MQVFLDLLSSLSPALYIIAILPTFIFYYLYARAKAKKQKHGKLTEETFELCQILGSTGLVSSLVLSFFILVITLNLLGFSLTFVPGVLLFIVSLGATALSSHLFENNNNKAGVIFLAPGVIGLLSTLSNILITVSKEGNQPFISHSSPLWLSLALGFSITLSLSSLLYAIINDNAGKEQEKIIEEKRAKYKKELKDSKDNFLLEVFGDKALKIYQSNFIKENYSQNDITLGIKNHNFLTLALKNMNPYSYFTFNLSDEENYFRVRILDGELEKNYTVYYTEAKTEEYLFLKEAANEIFKLVEKDYDLYMEDKDQEAKNRTTIENKLDLSFLTKKQNELLEKKKEEEILSYFQKNGMSDKIKDLLEKNQKIKELKEEKIG